MKIHSCHFEQVGPLGRSVPYTCAFIDEWQSSLHNNVLLSGPNGTGKSTILRAVAHLWALTGALLSSPVGRVNPNHPSRRWLSRWGGAAVILSDVPVVGHLGLIAGGRSFFENLKERNPEVKWLGESQTPQREEGNPRRQRDIVWPRDGVWLSELSNLYKQLILNGGKLMPNITHLDGEERRWVPPTKGLGEVVADNPQMKWLVGYRPDAAWKGQLEASLIALKTLDESKYGGVIDDLNQFLKDKRIDPQPDARTLRLRVIAAGNEGEYTLDDLSAGEHQVLIQIYLISRWMNKGGVVMIDEPDLHLHPSLLNAFLSRLEMLVSQRCGQLLLTSHNPSLWERYENKGLRIRMGAEM